ncbi:hypothetical protein [Janthinobacterium psychrotolerans]|uniref:Uncharacterized protein n=1 Tax=Janthinobacterium psychrotolerans TaxID=1747903 RepID=A0A1A7C2W8_9BURK|nr:hypothetical protein [Janthinobacterium psychrotolerans]OBV39354.1 hypothetical protein ASR47_1009169 [Janthinobacterium psychrotolerans]
MPALNQPSKEQVRAYMRRRLGARQPPPAPEEIRRQLAWRHRHSGSAPPSPASIALQGWLVSVDLAWLGTLLLLSWYIEGSFVENG